MNINLLYALTEELEARDSIESSWSFIDTSESRNYLLKNLCSFNKIRANNAVEINIICCGNNENIIRKILQMIPEKNKAYELIDKISSFLSAATKAKIYMSDRKLIDCSRNSRLALKALSEFIALTHPRFLRLFQEVSEAIEDLLKDGSLISIGSLKPQLINTKEIIAYNIQSMKNVILKSYNILISDPPNMTLIPQNTLANLLLPIPHSNCFLKQCFQCNFYHFIQRNNIQLPTTDIHVLNTAISNINQFYVIPMDTLLSLFFLFIRSKFEYLNKNDFYLFFDNSCKEISNILKYSIHESYITKSYLLYKLLIHIHINNEDNSINIDYLNEKISILNKSLINDSNGQSNNDHRFFDIHFIIRMIYLLHPIYEWWSQECWDTLSSCVSYLLLYSNNSFLLELSKRTMSMIHEYINSYHHITEFGFIEICVQYIKSICSYDVCTYSNSSKTLSIEPQVHFILDKESLLHILSMNDEKLYLLLKFLLHGTEHPKVLLSYWGIFTCLSSTAMNERSFPLTVHLFKYIASHQCSLLLYYPLLASVFSSILSHSIAPSVGHDSIWNLSLSHRQMIDAILFAICKDEYELSNLFHNFMQITNDYWHPNSAIVTCEELAIDPHSGFAIAAAWVTASQRLCWKEQVRMIIVIFCIKYLILQTYCLS